MILITGATGLLGLQLVKDLINDNQKIRLLIRNESDKNKFQNYENISFCIGNVNDIVSLEKAFENIKYVYHCAGKISFSPFEKLDLYKINVEGTANIVNFCINKNVEKLCHVSSVAAIGKDKNSLISDENVEWDESSDNSYYGRTKYLGELEVWRGIEEGLNAVIINPSVILGPCNWNQSSMKLFKYVKEEHTYFTKGGNNFVDVRDVSKIMTSLMNSDIYSERYVVAGKRYSYKLLFEKIAKELNVKPPKKEIKNWMLQFLWRLEFIKNYLFKTNPILTKETAKVSNRLHEYSSNKIINTLKFSFISLDDTIKWISNEIEN